MLMGIVVCGWWTKNFSHTVGRQNNYNNHTNN